MQQEVDVHQVAIAVSSLDRSSADKLLQCLPPAKANLIRGLIRQAKSHTPTERKTAIRKFVNWAEKSRLHHPDHQVETPSAFDQNKLCPNSENKPARQEGKSTTLGNEPVTAIVAQISEDQIDDALRYERRAVRFAVMAVLSIHQQLDLSLPATHRPENISSPRPGKSEPDEALVRAIANSIRQRCSIDDRHEVSDDGPLSIG